MTVTTTYKLIHTASGGGNASSEGDIVRLSNGSYAFGGTTSATTSAFFTGSTHVFGIQGVDPSFAQQANGRLVIAGEDANGILYKILNPDGTTFLNTVSGIDSGSANADVAALTNGGFVIVSDDQFVGNDHDIEARIYNINGVLQKTFSVLQDGADDRNAQVCTLTNGNFAVAWTRTIGATTQIWFAIYAADGTEVSAPHLHDSGGAVNSNVSLCATSTGFAMVYEDSGWGAANGVDISLSRIDFSGALIGTTDVSMTTLNDESPKVAVAASGVLVVSYGTSITSTVETDTVVKLVDLYTGQVLDSRSDAFGGTSPTDDVLNDAIAGYGVSGGFIVAQGSNLTTGAVNTDFYVVERTSVGDGANDVILGDGSRDIMFGGGGNDELQGGDSDDTLNGGDGNDYLFGGSGNDTMAGGAGNDIYIVTEAGDTVIELANEGNDLVNSTISYTLGANVETLTLNGNSGDISGTGNDLNNQLFGNAGNNILDGGLGADLMVGQGGDDTYFVDNTFDVVQEAFGEGFDTVNSSVTYAINNIQFIERINLTGTAGINFTGNDLNNQVFGNDGDNLLKSAGGIDTMDGGAGNDILDGGLGDDVLAGGLGIDTLDGGVGDDVMAGGVGNDTYFVDSAGDVVTEAVNAGVDQVFSSITFGLQAETPDQDSLEFLTLTGSGDINGIGNSLNNLLIGNSGANVLVGNEGGDVLNGGAGDDTLYGGLGDDIFFVDSVGDTVIEQANEGIDTVNSAVSYVLGATLENAALTGTGNTNLTGNAGFNQLTGNDGNNIIDGMGGADLMIGGLGDDTYYVDDAADVILEASSESAASGIDQVFSSVAYTINSGIENLTLTGTADIDGIGNGSANILIGNFGANTLVGEGGDDILDGGFGADTLIGGAGNDIYYVDNVGDTVIEEAGEGVDTVFTSVGFSLAGQAIENAVLSGFLNANLTGNGLNNVLTGNNGANVLNGDAGNDTLLAGAGDDILIGGAGNDTLNGGIGLDTADYGNAAGGVTASLTLGGASNDGDGGVDNFAGIENLTGSAFDDALTGGGSNNVLMGGAGNDTLSGLNGDDVLRGGAGVDILNGGAGIDVVEYVTAAAGVTARLDANKATNDGDGGTDTFIGIENLTGSNFNDVLIGDGSGNTLRGGLGADTLLGFAGNDILIGGTGAANTLQGGLGDDYYVLDANDTVTELAGEGNDTIEIHLNIYNLGANIESLTYVGAGTFTGTGNAQNNTITGAAGDDILRGRGGVDILKGGAGSDTADYSQSTSGVAGRIDFQLCTNDGEGGTDTYISIENLIGSAFDDLLVGDGGNNVLSGGLGKDTLLGGAGNDTLMGGQGLANQMQGGTGDDYYVMDAYDTIVEFAGEGIDTVEARVGGYNLGANIENLIYTGPTSFVGSGNTLNNNITGGAKGDTLRGMGGNDTIDGGGGQDTVIMRGLSGEYVITAQGAGWLIVDNVAGRDGSTFVTNVELLKFSDNAVLTLGGGPAPLEPVVKGQTTAPLTSPLEFEVGGDGGKALHSSIPLVLPAADDFVLSTDVGAAPALMMTAADNGPWVLPDEAFPLHNAHGVLKMFEGDPLVIDGPHGLLLLDASDSPHALHPDWAVV